MDLGPDKYLHLVNYVREIHLRPATCHEGY